MKKILLIALISGCFINYNFAQNDPVKVKAFTKEESSKQKKETEMAERNTNSPVKIITLDEANKSKQKRETAEKKASNKDSQPVRIKTFEADKTAKQKQEIEEAKQSSKDATEQILTKIIVVRHAEKGNDGTQDPPLSQEGMMRAKNLGSLLADVKVDNLFSTPYKRTMQTLSTLSEAQKVKVVTYNPSDKAFFDNFLSNEKGKTSVIAGHSNTAPMIVNSFLKANTYQQLPESEYGKIWILTFNNNQLIDCSLLNY